MYEALEHWKQYKQKQVEKAKMDKFLNKLITKNGTTEV